MRRVKKQKEAAEFLDLTPQRLRQMEADSPWWHPQLRTDEGYDVCGIVRAQLTWHDSAAGREEILERLSQAELASAEAKAKADQLKALELERQHQIAVGNILPADVYQGFCREFLGMARKGLEELPEIVADHVPPEVQRWIYVPENQQASERDASPLQKGIRKLIHNIEKWLHSGDEAEAS